MMRGWMDDKSTAGEGIHLTQNARCWRCADNTLKGIKLSVVAMNLCTAENGN